jgi:hypothetical protein
MTTADFALYWCTESWLLEDIPRETGLPEAECEVIRLEVEKVRRLYAESLEPTFVRLADLTTLTTISERTK